VDNSQKMQQFREKKTFSQAIENKIIIKLGEIKISG